MSELHIMQRRHDIFCVKYSSFVFSERFLNGLKNYSKSSSEIDNWVINGIKMHSRTDLFSAGNVLYPRDNLAVIFVYCIFFIYRSAPSRFFPPNLMSLESAICSRFLFPLLWPMSFVLKIDSSMIEYNAYSIAYTNKKKRNKKAWNGETHSGTRGITILYTRSSELFSRLEMKHFLERSKIKFDYCPPFQFPHLPPAFE